MFAKAGSPTKLPAEAKSTPAQELTLRGLPPSLRPAPKMRLVIPISGVHRAVIEAVNFARSISDRVTAVYIDIDPGPGEEELRQRWNDWSHWNKWNGIHPNLR